MEQDKKPLRSVQFIADEQLRGFIEKQANEKRNNSLVQLLNVALQSPRTSQDVYWWCICLMVWVEGDEVARKRLLERIAHCGKLTKADAGKALEEASKGIKLLVDVLMQGSGLAEGCCD